MCRVKKQGSKYVVVSKSGKVVAHPKSGTKAAAKKLAATRRAFAHMK